MDAEQTSQVLQRLQVLEQAATEQLNARRGAERALVEAQTKTTQLDRVDDLVQQLDKVVGTRVFGRLDKWDGSEKAWPNWSFVMKELAWEPSIKLLSADMTTAECSTDAMSNDTMTGEKKARSVQLYYIVVMLCTGRALDRIVNETCCDDGRSVSVSFGHKRSGEQSGDDGTEDQRVREIREHRNSGIPEDWHRDSSSRRRTSENASHHELAQVGNFQDMETEVTNVKQAQSAVKARSGDAMDVDAFTKGSKGASKGSGKKQDSEVVCWYCEKKGHRASDCRKKQRDNDSGKSKGSKKGDSKGRATRKRSKANATSVARQVTCQKTADPKKRVHSELATSWQRQDASKWQTSI